MNQFDVYREIFSSKSIIDFKFGMQTRYNSDYKTECHEKIKGVEKPEKNHVYLCNDSSETEKSCK